MKKKICVIAAIILLTLTGCNKQLVDGDKKRVMDDAYSSIEYMYKKLEELDGKILLISLSNKEYEKYDTVKASINALNIMKNIDVNNEKVNPHLLKPNYIKKIEAEAKL